MTKCLFPGFFNTFKIIQFLFSLDTQQKSPSIFQRSARPNLSLFLSKTSVKAPNMSFTLPETNSSPLKIGQAPKGKPSLPTNNFQGRAVSFREGEMFLFTIFTLQCLVF